MIYNVEVGVFITERNLMYNTYKSKRLASHDTKRENKKRGQVDFVFQLYSNLTLPTFS